MTPKGASALEVTLSVPREDDELTDRLVDASLLMELQEREEVNTQDVVASARADYQRLLTVLYKQAYYAPVVRIRLDGREAADLSPVAPIGDVRRAVIRVEPGPAFRFGRAAIAPVAGGTELPEEFAPGHVAGVDVLKDAASAGVDGWRAIGHAKADVAGQEITARHKAHRLDAAIRLAPGPRLRFGQLRVEGNEDVRASRIRAIAGLPSGETYSPKELDRATERLRRTGAFNVATLREAEEIGPNDTLDITAQISEAPKRRFSFGAEVSSTEGIGLSTMWMHRNLFGGAERLRLEGEVTGIDGDAGGMNYRAKARFERPATFQPDMDLYLETEIEDKDEDIYNARSYTLGAGIKHWASEHRTFEYGVGYRYAETTNAFGSNTYSMLTTPLKAIYDYRDNKLDAKSGYYAEASLLPFVSLRGTENGVRTNLDLRAYKSVGAEDGITFAARAQLGSVIGPSLAETPADFLFYSGGGGTVRGQPYQSLAVDLGGGNFVGGRSFLGLSGEIRVDATEKISVVGFYDAGYIGAEDFPDGSSGDWHSGAGLGLRYKTGIGPVRLDVGVPVTGPGSNSGFEVYIGIGQAF
ncbi:outer membrane protein assembly factor [Roseovarius spongiae]|uniref:Outer membrane protein assembly factor n=2 Tax=Roseovarius spongiae TaxID=2320272 RepID=A0A3A8ASG4_9RHOB|nr:outer membrane protein assembly factor [Roseovarius spongiae]